MTSPTIRVRQAIAGSPDEGGSARRVRLVTWLLALAGAVAVASSMHLHPGHGAHRFADPFNVVPDASGPRLWPAAAGVALLYVAGSLRRGRRSAWTAAIAVFGVDLVVRSARVVPAIRHHTDAGRLSLAVPALALVLLAGSRDHLSIRIAPPAPHTDDDWTRAQRLVRRYGTDTLSWFALRRDKRYFFSSDGQAMIAYAYVGRCALASGDPIGHPGSVDLVVSEFLAMCRSRGWAHAFLAVREDDAARYRRRGLRSVYLGDEAVIDCGSFTLDGRRNKSMRQSVNRVARTHRFVMLREVDAPADLVRQLNALSDRWRGRAPERGFTMALSQPVGADDPDHRLCVALDGDGRPGGFLRLVPVVGDEPGYTLDMMRREPAAPNGMMEFLIARSAFALAERGSRRLSMNFAVMGSLYSDNVRFSTRQRLARRCLDIVNPFFQIKSLHDFNRRFRPHWVRRVVVYSDHRSLPQIALLYGAVEGFVSLPVIGRRLLPRPALPRNSTAAV